MRITVLGSTGGTGREIVRQALAKGHQVTAVARNPAALDDIQHPKLSVVKGDVYQPATLEQAIQGADVVVSSIGVAGLWKARKPNEIYSKGTHHILSVMKKYSVERFIGITSGGVVEAPGEPFIYKYVLKPIFLENSYADMRLMEREVMSSAFDWTIVRPPQLNDGPLTAAYRLSRGKNFDDDKDLSRADLAHFIVQEVEKQEYTKSMVAISD